MSRCYVMLGKAGDILSILPILQHEFYSKSPKVKPVLMVSRKYLPIVHGLPFVAPFIWEESWQDLRGAMRAAKRMFREVVILQTFGRDFPVQHRTPSFQLDQWQRAASEKLFLDWPLSLERPVEPADPKTVLFADESQSSPFPYRDELHSLIKESLPDHRVLRLSEMRRERLLDFLPLYDNSNLIVSVETSHLHLTRACKTPVIAMVTDSPTRWHGSAWHHRFRMHCRYSDFPSRKDEISAAIKNYAVRPVMEKTRIETARANGYNLSIIRHAGSVMSCYRWHHRADWRTTLCLVEGGRTHDIIFPERFLDYSIEDGRLFSLNGKLMLSYVVARSENGEARAIVGYGELVNEDGWRIKNHFQPKFGNNSWGAVEKNWCPFEHDGNLHFIYLSGVQQIVIRVTGEKLDRAYKTPGIEWKYGDIHGGCVIPRNGKLLRFFHSHTTSGSRDGWIYRIGVSVMNAAPPFETVRMCSFPVMAANERWSPCKYWKQNVVFPGGVIQDGDGYLLAIGENDCECHLVKLRWEDFNL